MAPEDFRMQIEITMYRGLDSEIETKTLSSQEARSLNLSQFDHVYAPVWGYYAYRSVSGEWQKKPLDDCGLGPKSWNVVQALQLEPGVYLSCSSIGELARLKAKLPDLPFRKRARIAGRVRAIRDAHDETGKHSRFFRTKRNGGYALMWPIEFSWVWILGIEE